MAQARTFLDHLPISAADRERIAHGNAERLLGVFRGFAHLFPVFGALLTEAGLKM